MSQRLAQRILRTCLVTCPKCFSFGWTAPASRFFSFSKMYFQQTASTIDTLFDLTDYVNKQLFLYTPSEPKEKPLTTVELLNDSRSVNDVLKLVENMHRSNRLWKEELLLYHNAIISFANAINDEAERESFNKSILNHETFHLLLRCTATSSIHLQSNHLVQFLYCAGQLNIPKDSFIIKYTIDVMKKRLNDFFPKDVVICHVALKNFGFATDDMQSLQSGLVMHLENMAKDERFFGHSASDFHLSIVSNLVKYFGSNSSAELRKGFVVAIEESLRMRKRERIVYDVEIAITLLEILSSIQFKHEKLISKSIATILSGLDELTPKQKIHLQHVVDNLDDFFLEEKLENLKLLISSNSVTDHDQLSY